MIHVLAVIEALPGKRQEILDAFQANMPVVHAEQGCIEYQPVVDVESAGAFQDPYGEDTFVVIEKWQSMADLQAHAKSAHMVSYAAKVKDLIASRSVHVLQNAA